jgi:hypothetical protein
MTGLPSHCPKCGIVFLSDAFSLVNVTDAMFRNIRVGCPNPGCGGIANGLDGTFDFVGNAINVKHATPRTLAILAVLQSALREAQQGKPEAEVISEIEKASPELAHAIQKKVSTSGKPLLAGLLLTLLAGCSMDTRLDWNRLVDQVHVYSTGANPYPGLEQAEASQSESGEKPKPSRQQRRYKERQAKKQQRQTERQQPKKPGR